MNRAGHKPVRAGCSALINMPSWNTGTVGQYFLVLNCLSFVLKIPRLISLSNCSILLSPVCDKAVSVYVRVGVCQCLCVTICVYQYTEATC